MGNSMVKDIYGWELPDNNKTVVVKYFSVSTTEDMITYIKPLLKRNPNCFIIHVGTNDLRSSQDTDTVAKNVVEVANNSKTDSNKVLISSIVPQCDNLVSLGKYFLKKFCMENDLVFVNHDNIKPRQHCNYGGIHLNTLGSKICADNFALALNTLT